MKKKGFDFASLKGGAPEPAGMKPGGKNHRGGKKHSMMEKMGRGKKGRGC